MTHLQRLIDETAWIDDGTPEFVEWLFPHIKAAVMRDKQEMDKPRKHIEVGGEAA